MDFKKIFAQNLSSLLLYVKTYTSKRYLQLFITIILSPFFIFKIKVIDRNKFILRSTDFVVTTKCNLRCANCSNSMNYYDNPYMISADEIITDINSLLEVVDHLHMIGLLGGEPFLNRELGKIINHIHEHEKVSLIVIVTNGTIVPKEDLLELMQNKKILISISYYGDKSKKIVDKLKEYKISFELVKFDYWADLGNFDFRNRRKEEMIKVFDNCYQPKICWNMLHGEFHLCHRSSIGNDLGLIPRSSKDFVDLKSDDSIKLKREQLLKLINSKFINACNYCDGCEKEQIPAGVQN